MDAKTKFIQVLLFLRLLRELKISMEISISIMDRIEGYQTILDKRLVSEH